jgi:hypothetical protein
MRRTLGLCGVLGLVSAGVFACNSSPQIHDVPLGFNIVEGLLNVSSADPRLGSVILSSTGGNCRSYQQGLNAYNIALTDVLVFNLGVQDATGGFLPLTAGTYNVEMAYVPTAGNYAFATEYEMDAVCDVTPTGANSGTITLQPFNTDAGGASTVSYSLVFGYDRFTGAFPLTTCLIPASATVPDAGACYLPGGGGPI